MMTGLISTPVMSEEPACTAMANSTPPPDPIARTDSGLLKNMKYRVSYSFPVYGYCETRTVTG